MSPQHEPHYSRACRIYTSRFCVGNGSKCITACKALEVQRMAQDDSLVGAPDVFRTMMDLSQARKSLQKATLEWKNVKERTDKINKEALELQELVEKSQEEVQRLKAQLQPHL